MTSLSLGVNWYVNNNLNVMFDYVLDYRYGLASGGTPATTSYPGGTDGLGIRVQFQF